MTVPGFDGREWQWAFKQWCSLSPRLRRKDAVMDPSPLLASFTEAQRQRYHLLCARYPLTDWPRLCNQVEYRENLYLLDLLNQHLPSLPAAGYGLDIGCRSFSHLPALSAFMPGSWTGVELDAHARYWNGYTRQAYGEWMAQQHPDCCFIAGSLLQVQGRFNLLTWTLPFVLPAPLAAWGLPQRFFQPLELLRHAHSLLAAGGVMLIVNQGQQEADEQQRLFDECGVVARPLGELHSVFSPFRQPRFGSVVAA